MSLSHKGTWARTVELRIWTVAMENVYDIAVSYGEHEGSGVYSILVGVATVSKDDFAELIGNTLKNIGRTKRRVHGRINDDETYSQGEF